MWANAFQYGFFWLLSDRHPISILDQDIPSKRSINTQEYLKSFLSFFVSLTADPVLLCSLRSTFLLKPIIIHCHYCYMFGLIQLLHNCDQSTHNSFFETNKFLFFLLSAFKVNLNQSLKLH